MGKCNSKQVNKPSNHLYETNRTLRDDRNKNQNEIKKLRANLQEVKIIQEKKQSEQDRIVELRQEACALRPGCTLQFSCTDGFPDVLNVGLFGACGVGKTSLFNSLLFAVSGKLREGHKMRSAPFDYQGVHTTVRRFAVSITKHITFIDHRGIHFQDQEASVAMIKDQLEGRGSIVNSTDWQKPNSNAEMARNRKIYCSVLVLDATDPRLAWEISDRVVAFLHEWQGRYPIAVITHVDVTTPHQLKNLRMILHGAGIGEIYEVANITNKTKELEPKYQINLLEFLQMCMNHGDRTYEYRQSVEEQ